MDAMALHILNPPLRMMTFFRMGRILVDVEGGSSWGVTAGIIS